MNAIGIDVSKGKSMVAIMRPFGEVVASPFEVVHTADELGKLAARIKAIPGETKVVMEYTSKYYRPIANFLHQAGIFVCVANALRIHNYVGESIRRAKTDKIDSVKIACYGIDHWFSLPEYTPEEEVRELLKVYNRQYSGYTKMKAALTNSLLSLLDQTMPGVRSLFNNSNRKDGREKWVDFAENYWHCECIVKMSVSQFAENYNTWCRKAGYRPGAKKANELHAHAKNSIPTLPCTKETMRLIQTAARQLCVLEETAAIVMEQMRELAEKLPEYCVVTSFYGIGDRLGPRLMAEIGDVTRFSKKSALVAYAGLDAPPYQSGGYNAIHRHISKRGSPLLRKALFEFVRVLMIKAPVGDAIYEFICKKRAEGKPYKVYLMAGASKFLRMYYGRSMAVLAGTSGE